MTAFVHPWQLVYKRTWHIPISRQIGTRPLVCGRRIYDTVHVDEHNEADGCGLFTIAQLGTDYTMVGTSDAARFGSPELRNEIRMRTLVVEHDREERTMHMQSAISAQPAFVLNEPQLAELVQKKLMRERESCKGCWRDDLSKVHYSASRNEASIAMKPGGQVHLPSTCQA